MTKRLIIACAACLAAASAVLGQDSENLGTFSSPFSLTRGLNPSDREDPYTWYRFTITTPMDIVVSHCESTLWGNTGIHLSDADGIIVASNVGDYDHCVDGHAYVSAPYLLPGTYYLNVDWATDVEGGVLTRIEGFQPSFTRSAKYAGDFDDTFGVTRSENTSDPYVGYAGENAYTGSVCYRFYLGTRMDLSVSTCGSSVSETALYLLDANWTPVSGYWDDPDVSPCADGGKASLAKLNLAPGWYHVVAMGKNGTRGGIVTQISGKRTVGVAPITAFAIDAGTITGDVPLHVFEDTRDTDSPGVGYPGYDDYRNGVCYRLTLPRAMDVEISHCGSGLEDTEVYLLDGNGGRLAHNDNHSGLNACENDFHAYLHEEALPAGTYYVVSTGTEGTRGSLSTRIVRKGSAHPVGSPDRNYAHTRTYRDALGATWTDRLDYADGLGRPTETVLVAASPASGTDLVTYREYDVFGRESNAWLPVAAAGSDGTFVPLADVSARASVTYPGEASPYAAPVYEPSPLNRVVERYEPGQAWRDDLKAARTAILTNEEGNDTLDCRLYTTPATSSPVTATPDTLVSLTNTGVYAGGTLLVTRSEDEDGNVSLEFKDRQGKVVLVRQLNLEDGARETLDTYYIYDDFGNLVAALPPEASALLGEAGTWTNATSATLRDLAYLYVYDHRNRPVAKRIPGADWVYTLYDKADNPVYTQDGNQRAKIPQEWSFTFPDAFGRPALSGILTGTPDTGYLTQHATRATFAGSQYASTLGYQLNGSLTGHEVTVANYYDGYDFRSLGGFSNSSGTDFRTELKYDASQGAEYDTRYGDDASVYQHKGKLTGMAVAKLDDATAAGYLYSVMYYDRRGRVIQTKSTNQLSGGYDREYVAYDFVRQPTTRKRVHSATGKSTQTELYAYTYDNMGRPLTTTHQLNGGQTVTLVDNEYDGLGRLAANKRNSNANLRTDYTYNIRSWTKSVTGPLFSQTLYYNDARPDASNAPLYNGNISAMDWKVTRTGDNKQRGYNFAYDNLSRLTAADYREAGAASEKFSAAYSYDMHGNILSLQRHGNKDPNAYGLVDDVTFTYVGNQLVKADDAIGKIPLSASRDFKDTVDIAIEYTYDANGNMTMDGNNGIYSIAYNLLNLPKKITFAEPGVHNDYVYSASGAKLTVFHKKASTEVRTDYVGNMIYKNNVLDMILVDGGYIKGGQYHFYLQDHLGSNRVVARADGTVVQTNHYYPYGTPFAESYAPDVQDRKYIGKEYDTDNGLDWYDVEARMMDGLRFTTMDPLAEKYYSISPYVYCMGNPMKYVDPTGKDWVVANGTSNYEWRDDITAKSTLPEGYQYVGANNSDILNHMGLSHSLPTQKSNLPGMIAADAEVGRYSAAHMINVRTTSNVIIDANTSFNKDNATENNSMGRTFNGISVKVLETSTNTGAEGKVVAAAEVKLEYGGNTYVTNLKRAEGPQVMPQGSTVSHATINIPKSQLIYGTIPSSLQVRGNWFVSTPGGMTPITIPAGPLSPFFTQYFTHKWTFK